MARSADRKWTIAIALWVVAILNYLDRQIIFSLFPVLRRDLSMSDVQLGLLSSAFLFVYGAASLFAGYVVLRKGLRATIIVSLLFWSAITFLTGYSQTGTVMIAARSLMGLSEAFYIPAGLALIVALHDTSTRSTATALHQSGVYFGIIGGGALGGWFAQTIGWRYGFWILGAIGIAYAAILWGVLRTVSSEIESASSARVDLKTSISQFRRMNGFLPMLAVFCLFSAAGWVVLTWMPLYLYERFGMSLVQAGLTATLYLNIGAFSGIFLGGWLSDRIGVRVPRFRVYLPAAGFLCSAVFLTITMTTDNQMLLCTALTFFGFGRGLYDCNTMPLLCYIAAPEQRATGYGFFNFGGCLTGAIMAGIAGWLKGTAGLSGSLIISAVGLIAAAFFLLGPIARVIAQRQTYQTPSSATA